MDRTTLTLVCLVFMFVLALAGKDGRVLSIFGDRSDVLQSGGCKKSDGTRP